MTDSHAKTSHDFDDGFDSHEHKNDPFAEHNDPFADNGFDEHQSDEHGNLNHAEEPAHTDELEPTPGYEEVPVEAIKPKKNMKQFLIVGAGVVLVAVAAGGFFLMALKKPQPQPQEEVASMPAPSVEQSAPMLPNMQPTLTGNMQPSASGVTAQLTPEQMQAAANLGAAMGMPASSLPTVGNPNFSAAMNGASGVKSAPPAMQGLNSSQTLGSAMPNAMPANAMPTTAQNNSINPAMQHPGVVVNGDLDNRVTQVEKGLSALNLRMDAFGAGGGGHVKNNHHVAQIAQTDVSGIDAPKKVHHKKSGAKNAVSSKDKAGKLTMTKDMAIANPAPSVMFMPSVQPPQNDTQKSVPAIKHEVVPSQKMYAKGISDDMCWLEYDNSLKVYRVGDSLPDGSKLLSINAVSLKIVTSYGTLEWK